mmetsp:Transcript_17021/g.28262  ORF Transcript_17021/g.28262 Transcript_17021/m.28262 type:complete len:494 (+) Transcript_17021:70-1551(+)|eukprot:CAMPEP_0119021294 /NCGR_PEP_ID=MMETSP1176-20130426/25703_1 /TAXON_ID=265551 /ORGANISM="Synedropsis recta cf, Strain CCMP1620" /LENGTH=493 /DNA_ID=CAMNT_0006975865 /DNA_START=14 /DNA_END=1495 /DNA_ORIENTATION=+
MKSTARFATITKVVLSLFLLTCWVSNTTPLWTVEELSNSSFHTNHHDERTIQQRRLQQEQQSDPSTARRPLNVLSLGGSVTWGSGLKERRDLAYPSLLGKETNLIARSDNLAIRASSAVWPSQCLQTMIREEVSLLPSSSNNSDQQQVEVEYDVILLEFSLNGLMGLQLLLHRIRRRYPDAMIIYIDLYSNRKPGYSNCIGGNCRMTPTRLQGLAQLLLKMDAQLLQLPRPQNAVHWDEDGAIKAWFANDNHHLSAVGHEWITHHVLNLISRQSFVGHSGGGTSSSSINNNANNWLEGDLCFSWFKSGHLPLSSDTTAAAAAFSSTKTKTTLKMDGGTLHEFAKQKYAYEIPSQASLDIDASSLLKGVAPLVLVYMTKQNLYPRVSISLNDDTTILEMDSTSPAKWADDHVTATQSLGIVDPSSKIHVEIETLRGLQQPAAAAAGDGDTNKNDEQWPFRLVGLVLCAACRSFDPHFSERDCKQRACVDFVEDW